MFLIVVCACAGFMRESRSTVITLHDADFIPSSSPQFLAGY